MFNREDRPAADHTALLLRLSAMFNSSLDLEEVLNTVMDEVIVPLRAERGFIMLRDKEGEFQFKAARGIHQASVQDPRAELSLGVAHQVASSGVPVITSNALGDDRFSEHESIIYLKIRSILCVPLTIKTQVIGVVYLDNRLTKGVFTQSDLELLTAIAASAAIAIENARLYQVAIDKGRLESELQIARQVQTSLLPETIPTFAGWDFSALWKPARQVAGDFYDFIWLGPDQLGLIIADVTDKGVPAALFMALTHAILRASLHSPASAAADLQRANRLICDESTSGYFVTIFYAGLDLKTGQMTYVNAGHPPPLWRRAAGQAITPLAHTGMALGVDPDVRYTQQTIQLEPGDYLLAYTDGITEAFNARQEAYGENTLRSELARSAALDPSGILDAVYRSVTGWSSNPDYVDDITLLIASRQ